MNQLYSLLANDEEFWGVVLIFTSFFNQTILILQGYK